MPTHYLWQNFKSSGNLKHCQYHIDWYGGPVSSKESDEGADEIPSPLINEQLDDLGVHTCIWTLYPLVIVWML